VVRQAFRKEGFPSLAKRGQGRFQEEYLFPITDSLVSSEALLIEDHHTSGIRRKAWELQKPGIELSTRGFYVLGVLV